MPQVKTKSSKRAAPTKRARPRAEPGSVQGLIGKMLDYEAAALEQGVSFATGRFNMLTSAERQNLRAELIADYIRLSSGNDDGAAGYYDATLISFCTKICDMQIPSHELIGTYLAAVDVVNTKNIEWLVQPVRAAIIEVLQTCVDLMRKKAEHAQTQKLAA